MNVARGNSTRTEVIRLVVRTLFAGMRYAGLMTGLTSKTNASLNAGGALRGIMTIHRALFLPWLILHSCNSIETTLPPQEKSIILTVEEIGVTEVWLAVGFPDVTVGKELALERDGQTVLRTLIQGADTILVDDSLSPSHVYSYRAFRIESGTKVDSTDQRQLTTRDTTSHDFACSFVALGDGGSSELTGVVILSESLAYAVGEVSVKDSVYNVTKWDGQKWELLQVPFPLCDPNGNQNGSGIFISTGIHAVSADDIWLSCLVSLSHWNGKGFQPVCMPLGYGQRDLGKIWGTNNFLYLIGTSGFLAYNDGTTWQSVASGTTADFMDAWGFGFPSLSRRRTFAIASSPSETRILSLSQGTARDTLDWPPTEPLSGIWSANGYTIYLSGAGVWRNRGVGWSQMEGTPPGEFFTGIRGTGENNIFTVSWGGVVMHFNGVTWYQLPGIPTDFNFWEVAVSGNLFIAVGFTGGTFSDKAAILVGRHMK